jgi:hypothetical protein
LKPFLLALGSQPYTFNQLPIYCNRVCAWFLNMKDHLMRVTNRSISFAGALVAVAIATTSLASPASATDNSWISGPSLTHVSILATGAVATNSGVTLSTQTSTFTLNYHSSSADAGKFAQVNFFDFSQGVDLTLASSNPASPTGCDQQVLGGNSHSCMFKLDGSGSANVTGVISGATSSSAMKYILLSGPNIAQTNPANISFSVPTTTVKAFAATTKAMAGGAALVRFKFLNGAVAAASIRASVVLKGIGDHISASSVVSDDQGYVWVYVANINKKLGTSTVTVTVDGASSSAKAVIKWVKGTLAK